MVYPKNNLTSYLMDLRAYRPVDHSAYVNWLDHATKAYKVQCVVQTD